MDFQQLNLRLPSPIVELNDERLAASQVRLWLKRDDLIHPDIPGNKWRKLKYNLAYAADMRFETLLTFGGAYSNHLRATAAAGHYCGFKTIGVVRGEPSDTLNNSLAKAVDFGMNLTYMDRSTYRNKHSAEVLNRLQDAYPGAYILPEGGSNDRAVRGCAELMSEINTQVDVDVVCCPVGSGGTMAGLISGSLPSQQIQGYSALKSRGYLDGEVARLLPGNLAAGARGRWQIVEEFHHGGFAKRSKELDAFIAEFDTRHELRLEWVYVAKMLDGIFTQLRRGEFCAGTRILAVVTGGSFAE